MEIRTGRLIIREFTEADVAAVEAYHAHPEYRRFLPWEEFTRAKAREFVRQCMDMAREPKRLRYQFAVTLAEGGALIGSSGLRLNEHHPYEAHFACELDPAQWGRGYGSEICRAMVSFGFGPLALHRIYSEVVAENRAAARMLLNAGMQREGLFRENRFFGGHWWDTLSYGMIARDWKPEDSAAVAITVKS